MNKLKESLLEHITEATKSVLNMMAGLNVEKDSAFISNEDKVKGDVTGIIGLSNDEVKGSIAISFSEELGKTVVAKMLSISSNEITEEDLKDGIGEITNMVAGDFNNRIGNMFKLSLPSVITGKGHLVSLFNNSSPLLFKFLLEDKPFYLLSTFEEK